MKRALDVEGAIVLDISQLECVEATMEDGTKSYSYRGDTFADLNHVPATMTSSPGVHASVEKSNSGVATPDRPFGKISAPVILGSTHTSFQVNHTTSLSSVDHERLSMFLSYVKNSLFACCLLISCFGVVRAPMARFMNMLCRPICVIGLFQLMHLTL